MKIISISGFKNSGKTTLCRELLSRLKSEGFRVGYVKRTHEQAVSGPDTDSGSVREAIGSALLWNGGNFGFERALPDDLGPLDVASIFFPDADIVLMEGGKELNAPKIWVLGKGEEKPNLPGIFAVYDRHGDGDGGDVYGCGEVGRLAAKISGILRNSALGVRVYINDAELPIKDFICDFVEGGIRGMLGSLKGVRDGGRTGRIRIYIGDGREQAQEK